MIGLDVRARDGGVGERVLNRVGMAGLVAASGALVAGDFAAVPDARNSLLFTAVESVLVVPWALFVFRLDRQDLQRRRRRRWPIATLLAVHGVNVLLLTLCLYQKWVFVLDEGVGAQLVRPHQYRIFTIAAYVLANVGLLGRGSRVGRLFLGLADQPARLTALSFGLTALLGALVLNLPQALRHADEASFVDGLFTAVSAVCVTGLVVHPTAETYTAFGQVVILTLFQVGGLGIMILYSTFAVLAGRRLRVRSTEALTEILDAGSVTSLKRTSVAIVAFTLALEAVGAAILYFQLGAYSDVELGIDHDAPLAGAGARVWAAAFHAVSAFCNAGFTLFHQGAVSFVSDWSVCTTLMILIVLGGLGFPVLSELGGRIIARARQQRPGRLSLHSRIVLVTSVALIALGGIILLTLEHDRAFSHLGWSGRVLAALFQSVSARTAGFNTVDIGQLSAASMMLISVLMFIGASPGSTGGGIKTTTVAVLFATFRAELKSDARARLADRTVSIMTQKRAVGVFFLSSVLVATMLFCLLAAEPHEPLAIAFETFSAFATVGLSAGITEDLSTTGKLCVTLTMFVGRIGPLTLALALARTSSRRGPALAEESLIIG